MGEWIRLQAESKGLGFGSHLWSSHVYKRLVWWMDRVMDIIFKDLGFASHLWLCVKVTGRFTSAASVNLAHQSEAVFPYCCPDCLNCLVHLNNIGWTTWATWTVMNRYEHHCLYPQISRLWKSDKKKHSWAWRSVSTLLCQWWQPLAVRMVLSIQAMPQILSYDNNNS